MYIITVLFKIHAAHYPQFMTAMLTNAETSLKDEPECHQFDVGESTMAGQHEVFLYEVYASKEAFNVHLASSHFLEFNALTSAWIENKVVNAFERVHP